LAELLRSSGYQTAAAVANYLYLWPAMGIAKGFSVYDIRPLMLLSVRDRPFYLREGVRHLLSLVMDTRVFDARWRRGQDINRQAFSQLEHLERDRPFFLFLNYMDAHRPYVSPAPFDVRYPGKDSRFSLSRYESVRDAVNRGNRTLTSAELDHLISQYDGGIAYIDFEIGNLIARLRALGLYYNTLIIITSDHGEAFGEHNVMEHAVGSVYQDQVHIPLLIKFPGQREERRSEMFASQVDLMPTALDLAGIKPPPAVQGRTLRSPGMEPDKTVYAEASTTGKSPREHGSRRAIFSGPWKLITWTLGPPELYNLSTDTAEEHNLYRPDNPSANTLTAKIAAWSATIPRKSETTPVSDKSSIERLKSLGYAQ
jgi:arylsulfatase A-like enzyme